VTHQRGVPCAGGERRERTDGASDGGDGGTRGGRALASLERRARERLRGRLAAPSRRKLRTAMRHFKRFKRALGDRRRALREPDERGCYRAQLHNEWSLVLFAEYLATRQNRHGKRLAVDTVAQYISMVKQELSIRYGFAIAGEPHRLPQVIKALRRSRPKQQRRQRRGIRGQHLRAAWSASRQLREQSADAVNLWAAATTAWQAVARGGEVATEQAELSAWSAARRPTRADLTFHGKGRRRYAQLMLRGIKQNDGGIGDKVPILFARGDGGGDDTYAALRRLVDVDPCPRGRRGVTPLFRVGGRPMTVEQLRGLAHTIWEAAGLRGNVGAHSFRIGGATDVAANGGSAALLQAKGRWSTDIGRIYARMTRRAQLGASLLMQRRAPRDLEELCPQFTQGR